MVTAHYRQIPDFEELYKNYGPLQPQGARRLSRSVQVGYSYEAFRTSCGGKVETIPNRSTIHLWQRNIGKDEAKIGQPSLD